MAKKTVTTKKRVVKVDGVGQLHVHSSFNNIIVTIANGEGQVISWSSAGKMGFRGSKKNTPYAAQMAAQDCAKVAYDLGLRKVKAYVKGPGNGRESAIRTIHGAGIEGAVIHSGVLFLVAAGTIQVAVQLEQCAAQLGGYLLNGVLIAHLTQQIEEHAGGVDDQLFLQHGDNGAAQYVALLGGGIVDVLGGDGGALSIQCAAQHVVG